MKMKSVLIKDSVYKRLEALAEKEGEDINIVASVHLMDVIKKRELINLQGVVNGSPHKEVIEKWLM